MKLRYFSEKCLKKLLRLFGSSWYNTCTFEIILQCLLSQKSDMDPDLESVQTFLKRVIS